MSGSITDALKRPGVQLIFGLHTLLAVVLCFVPLFDVLGFERAFATGLLCSITSPVLGITLLRRFRERGGGDLARIGFHALGLNMLMLVPTAIAGLLVEAFSASCDTEEGLLFLLLVAGGNALFGTALGLFAGTLAHRRGVPGIIVTVTLLGFFTLALRRLYLEPQIFIYSVPFGFWPGSIYDEELSVSAALWGFRGYTFLFAAALTTVVRTFLDKTQLLLTLSRPRPTTAIGALCLIAATFWVRSYGERLGFDLDRGAIQRALSRRVVTEHFELFIDPSVRPEQVERIRLDHEFRYTQLERFFKRRPDGKIRSFIYRDTRQKARLMGAGRTQIARPWAREIHINGFEHPHGVLKHELAHVFAGEMAQGLFKVPAKGVIFVNIGIVEGIAVAADWPVRELTVHGWTRAMRALKLAPDMRRTLDVMGFWSISSAQAYTVAGSFVRYLVDQYGIEKFAELYDRSDFQRAYGRSLDALVSEWEAFIDALPLPKGDLLIAEHRFKRPGIFQKVCAHKTANLAKLGYQRLHSGDLEGGSKILESVLRYAPQNLSPLISMSEAWARQGELAKARSYAERALKTPRTTQKSSAEAREALANIQWREGDLAAARQGYEEVLTLHLSTPSDRLQLARLAVLNAPAPLQEDLRAYLLGDLGSGLSLVKLGYWAERTGTSTASSQELGGPAANPQSLVRYLYARRLSAVGAWPEAALQMQSAISAGLPGAPLLHEARLSWGRFLVASGRHEEAQAVFQSLADDVRSPGIRSRARDWIERAAFLAKVPAK